MSGSALAELVVLIVCVILAALASATETAMTSVGRIRIRHLEVVFSDLRFAPRQLSLFDPPPDPGPEARREGALTAALDRIRARYGEVAVGAKRRKA